MNSKKGKINWLVEESSSTKARTVHRVLVLTDELNDLNDTGAYHMVQYADSPYPTPEFRASPLFLYNNVVDAYNAAVDGMEYTAKRCLEVRRELMKKYIPAVRNEYDSYMQEFISTLPKWPKKNSKVYFRHWDTVHAGTVVDIFHRRGVTTYTVRVGENDLYEVAFTDFFRTRKAAETAVLQACEKEYERRRQELCENFKKIREEEGR